VAITNWKLTSHGDALATPYTFASPLTIGANAYVVVAHDVTAFNAQYTPVVATTGGLFSLVNSGDWLELRDNVGAKVDEMAYGTGYTNLKPVSWCQTNAPAGTANSVSRKPVNTDGDNCNDWVGNAAFSPGAATP
jgi:hypothetical protein